MKNLALTFILFFALLQSSFSYTSLKGSLHQGTLSGTIFFYEDASLNRDSSLVFAPGTVIKFAHGVQLGILGELYANGSSNNPIIITSVDDNSVGETIASSDGVPAPGDWKYIGINGLGDTIGIATFNHTTFRYGGDTRNIASDGMLGYQQKSVGHVNYCTFEYSNGSGLVTSHSEINVNNCIFRNNAFDGLRAGYYSHPFIKNSSFINNAGNAVEFSTVHITSNFTGNTMTNNGINGFVIRANDSFSTSDSCSLFNNDGIPFVFEKNEVTYFPLHINEGTIIKFMEDAYLYTGAKGGGVYGEIHTHGTKDNPVIFTSIKDDTRGGDTNNDGDATQAAPGDWSQVKILNGKGNLKHLQVYYGGKIYPAVEYWNGASGYMDSCIVKYSGHVGVNSNSTIEIKNSVISDNAKSGITVTAAACTAIISNNLVENNGEYGISTNYYANPTITNNKVNNNTLSAITLSGTLINTPWTGNTAKGNAIDGIEIQSISTNAASTFYCSDSLPFVVKSNMVTYPILTFEAGVVFKFMDNANIYTGNSSTSGTQGIIVNGTQEKPVIFTSINDDSFVNDTQGDGNTIEPAAGDWKNLSITKDTAVLKNAQFYYGGSTSNMAQISYANHALIQNCKFSNSASSGLEINTKATIDNCSFHNNDQYGAYVSGDTVKITNCSFNGNTKGILNGKQLVVRNSEFTNNKVAIHNNNFADLGTNTSDSAGNNIFTNSLDYHVYNQSSNSVFALFNKWGVNTILGIDTLLYDDDENSNFGPVIFDPWNNCGLFQLDQPISENIVCESQDENIITASKNGNPVEINWDFSPAEAGSITINEESATFNWNTDYFGEIKIWIYPSNDCGQGEASDTLTVERVLNPENPIIAESNFYEFCDTDSVTFSAPDGFDYLWQDDSENQTYTAKYSGEYFVKIINEAGCSSNSDTITVETHETPNTPSIMAYGDTEFCAGDSVEIGANNLPKESFTHLWTNGKTTETIWVKETGEFAHKLISTFGCESDFSDTLKITVFDNPVIPVISRSENTLSTTDAYAYQWYKDLTPVAGLVPIDGASEQSYSPAESGIFAVEISNENGCTTISEPFEFIHTGIATDIFNEIAVYPNPNNGLFTIINPEKDKPITIKISDVTGKIIYKNTTTYNQIKIDLTNYSGIYMINCNSDNNEFTQKLIINL